MLKWTASAQNLVQLPMMSNMARTTTHTTKRRRRATIANKENIPTVTSTPMAQYSSTLPLFEEEYSPSTVFSTGQQLAMRGLLSDPFLKLDQRYLNTIDKIRSPCRKVDNVQTIAKRKLDQEFDDIAQNNVKCNNESERQKSLNVTSTKMGDQTLDKLIDAILDSARKEEKKKKFRRKSFNLRRRTLLKNQAEEAEELTLSPSYAPGDDPASDLSFLLCESATAHTQCDTTILQSTTILPPTPKPATPSTPGLFITDSMLKKMPTPTSPWASPAPSNNSKLLTNRLLKRSRRQTQAISYEQDGSGSNKKLKRGNYFEIGVALPSIIV